MNNRTQKKLDKSGVLAIADMQRQICENNRNLEVILLNTVCDGNIRTLQSSDSTVGIIIKRVIEMKAELTELRKLKNV